MDMMHRMMEEMVEEIKKSLPGEVVSDIEELSKLQARVVKCAMRNSIIDTREVKRINELLRKHYFRGNNEPAERESFDFGEAIRRVKGGARVARKGWNGKGQHIQIACNISYMTKGGDIVNPTHANIGNGAIAFIGTSGTQIGWLASQADMLADDWYEVPKVKKEDDNNA